MSTSPSVSAETAIPNRLTIKTLIVHFISFSDVTFCLQFRVLMVFGARSEHCCPAKTKTFCTVYTSRIKRFDSHWSLPLRTKVSTTISTKILHLKWHQLQFHFVFCTWTHWPFRRGRRGCWTRRRRPWRNEFLLPTRRASGAEPTVDPRPPQMSWTAQSTSVGHGRRCDTTASVMPTGYSLVYHTSWEWIFYLISSRMLSLSFSVYGARRLSWFGAFPSEKKPQQKSCWYQ